MSAQHPDEGVPPDQERTQELLRRLDEAVSDAKMLKARIEHAQDDELNGRALGSPRDARAVRRGRSG